MLSHNKQYNLTNAFAILSTAVNPLALPIVLWAYRSCREDVQNKRMCKAAAVNAITMLIGANIGLSFLSKYLIDHGKVALAIGLMASILPIVSCYFAAVALVGMLGVDEHKKTDVQYIQLAANPAFALVSPVVLAIDNARARII